ncbi:MAG: lipoyl(octanoyl) transferase LipB [Bacteroidales bacterium]|nr:lipoyl(octanoyl) transferase LipB [Bacteroidales bacterium]
MHAIKYIDLGIKDFRETWELQQSIHQKLTEMKAGKSSYDTRPHLFIVEHPHVYTLGKSGKEDNLLINPDYLKALGATYYKTDRGGDITYHGPGQIVGYPIIDLNTLGIGVKQYIITLEQVIIDTLLEFDIPAEHLEGAAGVWLEISKPNRSRKICAMGVRVSRGITMHGFALNVSTDLSYFNHINPCGFSGKAVTSMEKELGYKPRMNDVKEKLLGHFRRLFGCSLI